MELQVNIQLRIAKSAREVFEAILEPAKMSHYFILDGSGRLEEEKVITWLGADGEPELKLKVTRTEPDRLVSFIWTASGVETIVEITLQSESETSTVVKIRENGWNKTDKGIASLAEHTQLWAGFLYGLKAFLEYGINLRAVTY